MNKTIGIVVVYCAVVFITFGIIGVFRFKHFYSRILVASNIDTVGCITLMIGVMVHEGLSVFSAKVLLILCFVIIVNPLVTHILARSAYLSGYRIER